MRCYAGCCSFNKLRPLPGHVYLSAPAVIDNGVSTVAVQQVQTTDCTQASTSKYRVSHEEVYSFDFVFFAHLSTDHFYICFSNEGSKNVQWKFQLFNVYKSEMGDNEE